MQQGNAAGCQGNAAGGRRHPVKGDAAALWQSADLAAGLAPEGPEARGGAVAGGAVEAEAGRA